MSETKTEEGLGVTDEPIYIIPPDLEIGPASDVLPLAGEANWGMGVFDVQRLRDKGYYGEGVTVGIIDTGVDRTHPDLSNCIDSADFTGSRYGPVDTHGHGTHTTGTVGATNQSIGVGPKLRTVHGKGLGDSGNGGSRSITNAMKWCVDKGATVLSMSLGSSGEDRGITELARELTEQGVWIIAAGGNSGPNTPDVDWPGRSPYTISVAALNRDLSPASFSSAGAKIDTSGPGVGIWSAKPGGGYRQMSGTSMATPFIAGLLGVYRAALLQLGMPVPKSDGLRQLLFSRSTDTHTSGPDRRTGPGWATPLLLSIYLTPDPPPMG